MNALETFEHEAPDVAAAFDGLIASLKNTNGLDAKTKQLIYIGIKAATGDAGAVKLHAAMAKSFEATRSEIRDTILITLTVSGFSGVAACLQPALSVFDTTIPHYETV